MDSFWGNTYVVSTDGSSVADGPGILPVTLRQGMRFRIHSYADEHIVQDWYYVWDHPAEKNGLYIVVR